MLILYDATIDCDSDTRKVYEWVRGEFETNGDGERVLDDGLPKPINPIKFPLQHCTITHFGSRLTISVPAPGNAQFRIDELGKAAAPKRATKGNKEIFTFGGLSTRLLRQNVDLEDASVAFTVTKWSAQHLPNQKLELIGE